MAKKSSPPPLTYGAANQAPQMTQTPWGQMVPGNTSFQNQPAGTQNFGGGGGGGKKSAPAPPDYYGAAQATSDASKTAVGQQTQQNRPDISTPWAQQQWTTGPDGTPQMSTGFSGPMAGISNTLQQQSAQALAQPMDTGTSARDSAINAAYGQASSRLNPQFSQQEEQLRTQLANQGLDPTSQAYQAEMGNFGRTRNDAYSSAMNSAIGQGTAAQQATFNENMAARQMPLSQLSGLQNFLAMPGFNAANVYSPTDYFGAAKAAGGYGMQANEQSQGMAGDIMKGAAQLGGAALGKWSDERLKQNIERHDAEVMPGVPVASFEYKANPGQKHVGVIAQDLEKVAPQYVHKDARGMRSVDYSKLKPFGFS